MDNYITDDEIIQILDEKTKTCHTVPKPLTKIILMNSGKRILNYTDNDGVKLEKVFGPYIFIESKYCQSCTYGNILKLKDAYNLRCVGFTLVLDNFTEIFCEIVSNYVVNSNVEPIEWFDSG